MANPTRKTFTAKDYSHLLGNLPGLSDKQLENHFELYKGYVKKVNEIEEKLSKADPASANYSYGEVSELLRRRPVAYNGVILHELYFENLSSRATTASTELKDELSREFGSFENWYAQAKAGLVSEPGWVLLTRSREDGSLRNVLLSQHHVGLLPDQDILLSLDGWEHAYMIDYGVKKADYISAIARLINWDVVTKRWEASQMGSRFAAA